MSIGNAARLPFLMHGQTVRWFRYRGRCPCYDPLTGRFDRLHDLCNGTGALYTEVTQTPPLRPEQRALITNYSARRHGSQYGELNEGDLVCSTFPAYLPLRERDQILIPTATWTATETLTRDAGDSDRLRETDPTSIVSVMTMHGEETEGFSLVGRDIVWSVSRIPAGERYTVTYTYTPRFIVALGTVVQRHRDSVTRMDMPQRVGLKLVNPSALDRTTEAD